MLHFNIDETHTTTWLTLAVIMRGREVRVRNTLFLPDLLGSSQQYCQCQRRPSCQV